jgi:hypothetical protein
VVYCKIQEVVYCKIQVVVYFSIKASTDICACHLCVCRSLCLPP